MKESIFKFGKIVTGESFIDRKDELKEIKNDVKNNINLFIYGPRRLGKTSLIKQLELELKEEYKKLISIYLDFFQIHSKEKFISLFGEELSRNKPFEIKNTIKFLKSILINIIPKISIDQYGNMNFEFEYKRSNEDLAFEEVFNIIKTLSERGFKVVVIFDEFQEIKNLDGLQFEKKLRSIIQTHSKLSYIFLGSESSFSKNLTNDPENPFYHSGKLKYIGKIPEKYWVEFIKKGFGLYNKTISEQLAKLVCETCDNISYYIQLFSYELIHIADRTVNKKAIDKVKDRIINEKSEFYSVLWRKLSPYQKKVIEVILQVEGKQMFSEEHKNKYNLSAPSSTSEAIRRLLEEEIIKKERTEYKFIDPFFKEWLKIKIL
ncbi:ATP-binding protein [bacterium]|nr:ATP-binding protein [bacterium]